MLRFLILLILAIGCFATCTNETQLQTLCGISRATTISTFINMFPVELNNNDRCVGGAILTGTWWDYTPIKLCAPDAQSTVTPTFACLDTKGYFCISEATNNLCNCLNDCTSISCLNFAISNYQTSSKQRP